MVDAEVMGQAIDPTVQGLLRAEHADLGVHPHKGLLHDLQGVLAVMEKPVGQGENLSLEEPDQLGESFPFTALDAFQQPPLVFARHVRSPPRTFPIDPIIRPSMGAGGDE